MLNNAIHDVYAIRCTLLRYVWCLSPSVFSYGMQIADYKRRLNDMQHEFADMLKETLDKMHDRLENSHGDDDELG